MWTCVQHPRPIIQESWARYQENQRYSGFSYEKAVAVCAFRAVIPIECVPDLRVTEGAAAAIAADTVRVGGDVESFGLRGFLLGCHRFSLLRFYFMLA